MEKFVFHFMQGISLSIEANSEAQAMRLLTAIVSVPNDWVVARDAKGVKDINVSPPKNVIDLQLSTRLENALTAAKLHTVNDVLALKREQLLGVRGLGINSYNELTKAMNKYGMVMRK